MGKGKERDKRQTLGKGACLCASPWEDSTPMSGPEASCCIFLHSFPRASFEFVLVLSSSRIRVDRLFGGDAHSSRGYSSETGKGKPPQEHVITVPGGQVAFSLARNSAKQWRVSTCEGRRLGSIETSALSVLTCHLTSGWEEVLLHQHTLT